MKKEYKILLKVTFILIILFLIIFAIFKFSNTQKDLYKVVDKISDFNYTLDDRDTKLMKNEFNKLKKILESDSIDYGEYAKELSNLFVIDLFTINNKTSKYDVGGTEYVFEEVSDNFKLNVIDNLYKYVGNSNSKYPAVKEIVATNIIDTEPYTYNKKEYETYKVEVTWNYEEDLGYDKKGEIILVKEDNKLAIVSYKGVE